MWRGFTLIEAVVSLLIASGMLVAALNTVGAARATDHKVAERTRGLLLAQALMAEILQQEYTDPDYGLGSFGLGADEATGTRSLFEDVDDYHGWQASPPQRKDGTPIAWAQGYEEVVTVAWVNPADLSQTSGSETGVKRIEVTINRNNRMVASLVAYRTQVWVDPVTARGSMP